MYDELSGVTETGVTNELQAHVTQTQSLPQESSNKVVSSSLPTNAVNPKRKISDNSEPGKKNKELTGKTDNKKPKNNPNRK